VLLAAARPYADRHVRNGGQALVETALSLSVLVFLLIGGGDFARVFAAQVGVMNSARAGAEAGVVNQLNASSGANITTITSYVTDELGRVPGVDSTLATVTVTWPVSGGVTYVQTRVQYTYRTLIAWPLVPNTVTLDRSASMRIYP
jgi:Flp pilus assembly protein TadG